MTSKYETKPGLKNRNNSHTLIVEFIGTDKKVLDVGAATGYIAETLSNRGCRVTGIEVDPEAAHKAEEHCERVVVGDVESLDLDAELGDETFDVIVFGDLLEHLKDPLQTLKRFKPFLNPEGYAVASIPNVAHGSIRLALLQGEFRYRKLGLLDDTHLRFFTLDSVEQLFTDAGFVIDVLERTRRGIFDTEIEVDSEAIPEETLNRIRKDPESLTYQFVLTAYPSSASPVTARLGRIRLLEERLAQRDRLIHELSRSIYRQEELQRRSDDLSGRLAEKEEEVSRLAREVASRNHRLANQERTIGQLRNQIERLGSRVERS